MNSRPKEINELHVSENKINDFCSKENLAYLKPGEDDGRCAIINANVPCWQPTNYNALKYDFKCNKKSDAEGGGCDYYTISGSNWECKNFQNPDDPTYGPGNYAIPLPKGKSCTKDGKLPPDLCTNNDGKCTPDQRGWCMPTLLQDPNDRKKNNSNARYPYTNCECAYIPNGCPTDKGWKVAKVKGKKLL